MSDNQKVTQAERTYLRDLARKVLEYANLPVMAERTKLWYAHNELKGPRPMVVFESGGALGEMMPKPQCTSDLAKQIEWGLQVQITEHEMLGDDKVVAPEFRVGWQIGLREFDMDLTTRHAADTQGRELGFEMHYPIKDLPTDLPRLKHSTWHVNREATLAQKAAVEEVIGDLMPVVLHNWTTSWIGNPSYKVLRLMGMENMLVAMMDWPDLVKQLYAFVTDDIAQFLLWMEREGLLTANNGNHYAGAGSYGFSRELAPQPGKVRVRDLWMNMNSQETVGISPEMFAQFVAPSYQKLSEMAGLVYYGCCEPVHTIWDSLSKLARLRKVSVSPWCDEVAIGEALRKAKVIYSRKPRPNYIGVGTLDEDAFREHISQTVRAARGGNLEIVFRDIYTLTGDNTKPKRAVQIVREQFEKIW